MALLYFGAGRDVQPLLMPGLRTQHTSFIFIDVAQPDVDKITYRLRKHGAPNIALLPATSNAVVVSPTHYRWELPDGVCLDYHVASDVDWVANNKDVAVRTVFMHGFVPDESVWKTLDVQQVFATKLCAISSSSGNRLAAVVVELNYVGETGYEDSWCGEVFDHYIDLNYHSDAMGFVVQWTLGDLMS